MAALSVDDDAAYALLQELWAAQDPAAFQAGTCTVSDDWATRCATALTESQRAVQQVALTADDGVLRAQLTVSTPLGTFEASCGVTPELVRVDATERRVELRIVEPLSLGGGGIVGGLAGLLGGSVESLAAQAIGSLAGVTLDPDGTRCTVDLAAIPKVEALCQRPWLGRPLCHYLQVVGITVGTGQLAIHWRTGLDAPATP